MTIEVAFNFLKYVLVKKILNRNRVLQSRSTREETIKIELILLRFNNFNDKIMIHNRPSRATHIHEVELQKRKPSLGQLP